MYFAKRGELWERGTWRLARRDGETVVNFCCPDCGAYGTLLGAGSNHEIEPTGLVSPGVVCDCGFHEHVGLVAFNRALLPVSLGG